MYISDTHLKSFLADAGLVSQKDFDKAEVEAKDSGKPIGDILIAHNMVGEDELRRTYAYIFGIPFVALTGTNIKYETLSLIPEPVARRNNIIAYNHKGDELEVAMLNTDDLAAIDFIKKKTRLKILPRLTDVASIKAALKQYQQSLKDNLGDVIRKETEALEHTKELKEEDLAAGVPAVRIVDTLLRHAGAQNASDIHIEPLEDSLLIRYRIDGILHDAMELPKLAAPAVTARIKVLANMRLDEKRLPQDGRFSAEGGGEKVSFRVSVLPTYFGEKIVMRLLRDSISGFTLESIGFHGEGLERMHEATRKTTGMILSCGPTGSGKSTTLYTILDIVNTPNVNISTVEDPIEYQMARINQTQVRPEIGFTFANGLRTLVRQDPDIIMVGEIRDKETASLAINASLTGHLVLSTLHTNSAAGAIPRLLDMGIEPFLLVSTLRVIIGQRLVRRLTPEKEKYALTRDEQNSLEHMIDPGIVLRTLKEEKAVAKDATWKDISFSRPKESAASPSGYSGRVGIYEVMSVNSTIKELIMKNATGDEIEKQARSEGMLTMSEDGIFKAAQGETSIEEVLRVITE
ncbi:MAG: Type II secretion system protein E [Candidatus Kaiserbacteria bacterium GW2011_GWC2_52_8b]|uniref:Type II secretion system protein E n=2 Tax=Candidatus Kaiseribacteriota TaxID=1752734 RepID=A0A0G2AD56_9BACT|nr:MAG: Type II secretion system protein E [Candidatus Kaiserbacteria bacterium GW2011_GWA2_52_12]KKW30374.1 MAG: Type II secretion system protein E [Candidatus Kaiserbacteria bacterium GW2011_GWC2_52_8b]